MPTLLQSVWTAIRFGGVAALMLAPVTSLPAHADAQGGDLVRLPGTGELKQAPDGERQRERLVPGGGLFLSFDRDGDGLVTAEERRQGIATAFAAADADGNGSLTALEQQAWAASLPTRDESLANPARFDPNLDRRVSREEFAGVITAIASAYADASNGQIRVADLKTTVQPEPRQPPARERLTRERIGN